MAGRRKAAGKEAVAPVAAPVAPPEPIRIETGAGGATLHLEGVVGVAQARRLHQLAVRLAGSGKDVTVRCEHLQHLDCAAAQVLLALQAAAQERGTGVTLRNLPDSVQQTLRHAGLAGVL